MHLHKVVLIKKSDYIDRGAIFIIKIIVGGIMDYGRFLICPRDKLQSVGSFVVPENMIDVFWTWVLRCQASAIVGFWLFKELTIHRSWDAFLSFSKTTKRSRHKKGVEVKSFLKEPSNGLSSPHTARIKWFISSDTLKAQKATFCEINLKRSTWFLKKLDGTMQQ